MNNGYKAMPTLLYELQYLYNVSIANFEIK